MRAALRVALTLLFGLTAAASAEEKPAKVDFDREVRPILADRCFACHGPDAEARKSGLRLDRRDEAIAPADSGEPAIIPGDPAKSGILQRVSSTKKGFAMPPASAKKAPLSDGEKEILSRWIAQGAEYRGHWSFSAPTRPEPPAVQHPDWARNDIDRFLLATMERRGLAPSPEADRATLLRRISLDLTGLPPTLSELDHFLEDKSSQAYEKQVDRLLSSPRFGERMALEWLDAARFADTNGYHIDNGRDMTRWRKWVIDAYNANMPFDRFTIEQLAGDLLPRATLDQKIASGFNRNHMTNFEGGAIPDEYLNAYVVDRVNTTSTVWLGLTVGCAQCHDHKFDPIKQKEYYSLYSFFHNVPENGLDGNRGNAAPMIPAPSPEQKSALSRVDAEIATLELALGAPNHDEDATCAAWIVAVGPDLPKELRDIVAIPAPQRTKAQARALRIAFRAAASPEARGLAELDVELRQRKAAIEAQIPTAMVMAELSSPRDTFVLVRGQYDQKGEKVSPGVPAFLPPLGEKAPKNRLGLARWLVDPAHPLTARVAANRLWQTVFGTGLVKTSEDFGTQGEPPTHPELLDWLAVEFRESGWNVKRLIRAMVTSSAYRQVSSVTTDGLAKDPENRLLARAPRLRLAAEPLRDQALFASGLLREKIGGPSVSPYQPAGLWEELMSRADGANWTAQTYTQSHHDDLYRRTMYTFWKRTSPPPSLSTFDAPDRETCTVRRARTNTPLQALVMLNDPTYVEASRKLAERILREVKGDTEDRIGFAFRLLTARTPRPQELAILKGVFESERARFRKTPEKAHKLLSVGESPANPNLDPAEVAAWSTVSGLILNLDEVVTKG